MIAKMPTLAAMAFKYAFGQPFVYPKNELDYSANFLRMCFSVPCEEYKVNAVLAKALDPIFILQLTTTERVHLDRAPRSSSGATPWPASRPASLAFGVRPTGAPTRRR